MRQTGRGQQAAEWHDTETWARGAARATAEGRYGVLKIMRRTIQEGTLRALAKGRYISSDGTEVILPTRWMKEQAEWDARYETESMEEREVEE